MDGCVERVHVRVRACVLQGLMGGPLACPVTFRQVRELCVCVYRTPSQAITTHVHVNITSLANEHMIVLVRVSIRHETDATRRDGLVDHRLGQYVADTGYLARGRVHRVKGPAAKESVQAPEWTAELKELQSRPGSQRL